VALAPHPDDVAFSIGGLVGALALTRAACVVTVCGPATWAPGLPPGTAPAEIAAIRDEEDERWCRLIGARRVALGFSDSSLRGFDDDTELTDPPDAAAGEIGRAVRSTLLACAAACVLCPMALGGHVDHRIVRDAAVGAVGPHGRIAFYEDLPYAVGLPEDAIAAAARTLGAPTPVVIPLAQGIGAKLAIAAQYRSQLRPCDERDIELHARAVGGRTGPAERIWLAAPGPLDRSAIQWLGSEE
jgi:LmbE family N-acetylglucosaminyl deacetylase